MADIKKELNDIKNAVYGRDVRGSIHDGIKKINEESEESKAKADEAHDVMESIINEGFDNAALEANFEQKLDDKIANLQPEWTGFKEDITTQLAQTEQKVGRLRSIIINVEDFGASNESNFDSTTAIQDAIDFVSSLGGGVVRLPAGRWRTSSKLILKKNVALIGAGMGTTVIQIFNSTEDHVIELETNPWKTTPTYQMVRDLTIDGNKSGKTGKHHGIYCPSSVEQTTIQNVEIRNCTGDGARFISAHRNFFNNVYLYRNNGNGLTLTSEQVEGIGSVTDNHLEMVYVYASNNGGHGFYFNQPVDMRAIHLSSIGNLMDGFHISNPAGGWCNTFDTLISQGNRNGIYIEGGGEVQLNNYSCSVAEEYNLYVLNNVRSIFNNGSLHRGGSGNAYINNSTELNVANLTSRLPEEQDTHNIFLTNVRLSNISNVYARGGLIGIDIINMTKMNNFNNIEVNRVLKHGISVNGTGNNLAQFNSFVNILLNNIGSANHPDSSAMYVRGANRTTISHFRNTDEQNDNHVSFGIELSHAFDSSISSSFVQGVVRGIEMHIDNNSIISDTVFQGNFND